MSNGDPEKKPPACRALSRKLDCPNMKEVGLSMSSEDYECAVCGESLSLDYDEMR